MSAYGNDIAHDLLGDSMIDLTHGKGSKIWGAEPESSYVIIWAPQGFRHEAMLKWNRLFDNALWSE
jgi:hypothetical protein